MEKLQQERSQAEARLRELEQRVYSYMEREKKITEDNQHQIDKAAELNGTLRRQLDEKCGELSQLKSKFDKEVPTAKSSVIRWRFSFSKWRATLRCW